LQVIGAINAYTARMAEATGYKALYLSGGGVAANSLGMPDLGISTLEDVLTDVRRITEVTTLPLLVDIDTGWGGAFNIARTIRAMIKAGAGAVHLEDQVGQKRCGHRPGKEVVSKEEMVDRVKSAVDARSDAGFVIMARTDALAVEGIDAAIERAVAYVEAGADMIFPEAMTELWMYKKFKAAVKVPILANITEFGHTPLFTTEELRSVDVDMVLYCCGSTRPSAPKARRRTWWRSCRPAPTCISTWATTPTKRSSTRCSPSRSPRTESSCADTVAREARQRYPGGRVHTPRGASNAGRTKPVQGVGCVLWSKVQRG